MATRKPLVLIDGVMQELPAGDTTPGGGDMLRAVYDTDNSGSVDLATNAAQLAGAPASVYARTDQGNAYTGTNTYTGESHLIGATILEGQTRHTANLDALTSPALAPGLYAMLATNRSGGDGEAALFVGDAGTQGTHFRVYRVSANGTAAEKLRLSETDLFVGTALQKVWHGGNFDPASRVEATDPRLADARTPTPHAGSHAKGGTDALTLSSLDQGNGSTGQVWTRTAGGASWQTVSSPGSPADLADGLPGTVYNATLNLFPAPRALQWTAGSMSLGTAQASALTLTVSKNGTAVATLSIPANSTASGALSSAVTFAEGDRVSLVLSGAAGGADLTYRLKGETV